jgi:hypothetical protein
MCCVGIDACQALAGEFGGDRRLPGARTAGDLNGTHRCLSSAGPKDSANEF